MPSTAFPHPNTTPPALSWTQILTAEFSSYVDPDTVQVVVGSGPKQEIFTVSRRLLCSSALFFDRAFNGSFKEAEEKLLTLADEEPETFRHYTSWLYDNHFTRNEFASREYDIAIGVTLIESHIKLLSFSDRVLSNFTKTVAERVVDLTLSITFKRDHIFILPQEVLALLYEVTPDEYSWVKKAVVMNILEQYHRRKPWMELYKVYRNCLIDVPGLLEDVLTERARITFMDYPRGRVRVVKGWWMLGWKESTEDSED